MAKSQIYVPQTGTIYPSAAAAAAALGVDASNIGKVLRGARTSAGGYNFVRVAPEIAPSTLRDISEAFENLPEKQKKRQAKTRQKYESRLAPEEAAALKERNRAQRRAARELQKQLREVNRIQKEYRKQGLEGISGIIPELEKIKDIIGRNKRGGFNADLKNLTGFSEEQIKALSEAVKRQRERKGFGNIEDLKKKKQAVAYQMGVSAEELDKYESVMPILWNLLALARRVQGKGYDQTLYTTVQEAMQFEADPEDLRRILQDLYNGQMAALEDETGEDMEDSTTKAVEELQGMYEDPAEASEDLGLFGEDDDWIIIDSD